jgi:hypothetical protein
MFRAYILLLGLLLPACALYFENEHDAPEPDAAVVALPPSEPRGPMCVGFDCPDAANGNLIDAAIDAAIDAPLATHPPFPQPSPCDTCVGFSCETVCADAGVDAP